MEEPEDLAEAVVHKVVILLPVVALVQQAKDLMAEMVLALTLAVAVVEEVLQVQVQMVLLVLAVMVDHLVLVL
jgi:hypothetical protein